MRLRDVPRGYVYRSLLTRRRRENAGRGSELPVRGLARQRFNIGGPGSEAFLAGHPEGTLDQNGYSDHLAQGCTQMNEVALSCSGSKRNWRERQAKDLVGFNTPWRFESSLRHPPPPRPHRVANSEGCGTIFGIFFRMQPDCNHLMNSPR